MSLIPTTPPTNVSTTPTNKPRILFVDDDPAILGGLRNVFRRDRHRWEVAFASDAELALAELRAQPFDVIVTDMRMPGMSGDELLRQVRVEFPSIVRIMLSGQSDRDAIVRALPSLHQLLSKPCDTQTLRTTIERSLDCGIASADARVAQVVGRIEALPSPPLIYLELKRLNESSTTTSKEVAQVVLRDPGLAAKVLQLVNSAYFGARQHISSIEHAVSLLGSDRLRYLALSSSVFAMQDRGTSNNSLVQQLQAASLRAALITRGLLEGADRDDGFAGALLHDIGHLILAVGLPAEYAASHRDRHAHVTEDHSVEERAVLGVSHADVGAWLLALWGVPNRIVDIVRCHHDPGAAQLDNRTITSAVHIADVVVRGGALAQLDLASLERAGTSPRAAEWFAAAQTI